MCTRFLFAVLPAELYWGEKTLRKLNGYFADNLLSLYEDGLLVARSITYVCSHATGAQS